MNKYYHIILITLLLCNTTFTITWWDKLFTNESMVEYPQVSESGEKITIQMTVPAHINPHDIRIEIKGKNLHIYGSENEKSEVHNEGYFHASARSSSFSQVVALSSEVNDELTSAEIRGNQLLITLFKKQEKVAPITIKVLRLDE